MTIINLGGGDDEIVVGTVPLVPDPGNRTLEFPDGVPVADTENMTNGNSAPLFVLGEGNNDRFEVNHNRAKLFLHGGSGNDRFLLKTFLVLRENPEDNQEITNLTTLFGGTGTNRYDYLQNAPVFINGGPGLDTIVVIGTPIGDTFIVTDVLIVGAGRITTFLNIEAIEIDGAGGPDMIWIMATGGGFSTTVIGGSGDDTIHLGGAPPPLILDPPPFVYTPPPIVVEQPPEIMYEPITRFDGAYVTSFERSFFDSIVSFFGLGGNSTTLAQLRALDLAVNAAKGWLDAARAQVPYFRNPTITVGGVSLLDGFGNLRTLDGAELTTGAGPDRRRQPVDVQLLRHRLRHDHRGADQRAARHVRGRSLGRRAEADPAAAGGRRPAAVRVRRRPGVRRPLDRRAPDDHRRRRRRDRRRQARRAQPAGQLGRQPARQPGRPAGRADRRGPGRQPDLRPRVRHRHRSRHPALQRVRQPRGHGPADGHRPGRRGVLRRRAVRAGADRRAHGRRRRPPHGGPRPVPRRRLPDQGAAPGASCRPTSRRWRR